MIEQIKTMIAVWEKRQKNIEKQLELYPDVCPTTAAHNKCIANTYKRCVEELNQIIQKYDY